MMSVILFILKLIGIILLALFGLILILVIFVVFVPVRYQVSGQIEDETLIHAKVSWLLHAISFHADYQEGEFVSGLYILGFRMKAGKKSTLEDEADKIDDAFTESEKGECLDVGTDEPHANTPMAVTVDSEHMQNEYQHNSPLRQIWARMRAFFLSIQSRIRRFFELLHRIKIGISASLKNISSLKAIITNEANQIALSAVLAELKYLLEHFRFRKLITDIRFSAGDPAVTGQALGVLCMFPFLYQYQVNIIPDFESEESYVKGMFRIKGRVRVLHLLVSLIHLWKKREVRILAKKLLK